MSDADVAVGAAAPALAATWAYVNARVARRQTAEVATTGLATTVASLEQPVRRTESGIGRIESGIGELRERVARLDGHLAAGASLIPRPTT